MACAAQGGRVMMLIVTIAAYAVLMVVYILYLEGKE